jgi:hypothetical protein
MQLVAGSICFVRREKEKQDVWSQDKSAVNTNQLMALGCVLLLD